MAVRSKLETKGFAEYLEKIAAAGRDIDPIAGRALDAGGDILLSGMQRRVPKDTRNLEQHLEKDGPHQDGNFHYIEVGLSRRADADTARYGNAQEFGTSSMAAQPYIRPTLDSDMGKARAAMKQVFEEEGVL
jgi:HK97 gp10 family phage protein